MNERHFVTGKFQSHATFVPSEEFGMIRDNVVRTTTDCVVVNERGEMLLGKRSREPQPDWWIIGGGMKPGESFEISAARNIKRELSLTINPVRFKYLNVYSFVWGTRNEPPKENGCHDVSITMVLLIDDVEIAVIKPNDEYKEMQWIKPQDVVPETKFHPAVRKYAEDLIKNASL